MPDPATSVFAYGSLVVPEVWALVAGCAHPSEEAVLPGHRRRCLAGVPYPGVVADPEEEVPGVLWRDVDAEVTERLDDFEGDAYERVLVEVVADGGPELAWVYVIRPSAAPLLTPEPWDEAVFRERELERYLEGCRRFAAAWTP